MASNSTHFLDDESRWQALTERNKAADGWFFFSVLTTGVFCKPSCGARQPNRENVTFYSTSDAAIKAGYRPCKRCRPTSEPLEVRHAHLVEKICHFILESEEEPSLSKMAKFADINPQYLNKMFKKHTGLTPKQFIIALRSEALKKELKKAGSITSAIYAAGYGTASRFYDAAKPRLGMPASIFKKGADGFIIRYTIEECWLGLILVAATEKGICSILFGDTENQLAEDLHKRFPKACLENSDPGSDFKKWVNVVLCHVKKPSHLIDLPLDIHGTVFQERVWRALQTIPAGKTASYLAIAKTINMPKASRAVARACAANPIAVVIPCHRVVRSDGDISGYRWGENRKRSLLDIETS